MKNLILIVFIVSIAFLSCDGRNHRNKSKVEVLKAQHLYDSFSTQLEIIPEKPVVIETDTILSNGFELHLEYTTLEKSYNTRIIASHPKKELNYKNFSSDLICKKAGKIILNQRIDKSLFQNYESPAYWDKAIMQYVWIDYEASLKDKVYLNTSFYLPETDSYKDFTLVIDAKGHLRIEPKTYTSKTT